MSIAISKLERKEIAMVSFKDVLMFLSETVRYREAVLLIPTEMLKEGSFLFSKIVVVGEEDSMKILFFDLNNEDSLILSIPSRKILDIGIKSDGTLSMISTQGQQEIMLIKPNEIEPREAIAV